MGRKSLQKTKIEQDAIQRCVADYSFGKFKMRRGEIGIKWKDKSRKVLVIFHIFTGVQIERMANAGYNPSKRDISNLRQEFIKMYWSYLEKMVRMRLRAYMARQFGPIPKGLFDEK